MPLHDSLPFLYSDGDTYHLELQNEGEKFVRLISITRYLNNQNTMGIAEKFHDLHWHLKKALIEHINRRYPGKTVKV